MFAQALNPRQINQTEAKTPIKPAVFPHVIRALRPGNENRYINQLVAKVQEDNGHQELPHDPLSLNEAWEIIVNLAVSLKDGRRREDLKNGGSVILQRRHILTLRH
jgi:hypothetical protein